MAVPGWVRVADASQIVTYNPDNGMFVLTTVTHLVEAGGRMKVKTDVTPLRLRSFDYQVGTWSAKEAFEILICLGWLMALVCSAVAHEYRRVMRSVRSDEEAWWKRLRAHFMSPDHSVTLEVLDWLDDLLTVCRLR